MVVSAIAARRFCRAAENFHSTSRRNRDDAAGKARDAAGLC